MCSRMASASRRVWIELSIWSIWQCGLTWWVSFAELHSVCKISNTDNNTGLRAPIVLCQEPSGMTWINLTFYTFPGLLFLLIIDRIVTHQWTWVLYWFRYKSNCRPRPEISIFRHSWNLAQLSINNSAANSSLRCVYMGSSSQIRNYLSVGATLAPSLYTLLPSQNPAQHKKSPRPQGPWHNMEILLLLAFPGPQFLWVLLYL